MIDMTGAITPKSDRTNADDFFGGPATVKITGVELTVEDGRDCAKVHLEGRKPWFPCRSMARVLVDAWGPDGEVYAGRKLILYRDPTVKFGGAALGGIRISHMSHISMPRSISLTITRGKKSMYNVEPLVEEKKAPPEMDNEVLSLAREAATGGTKDLRKFWSKTGPFNQRMLAAEMEKKVGGLKAIAAEIDADGQSHEDGDEGEHPGASDRQDEQIDSMDGHAPDQEQLDKIASDQDQGPDSDFPQ